MTEPEVTRAAELYSAGNSLVRVGTVIGFDVETVRLALRRTGIPLRDPHGLIC